MAEKPIEVNISDPTPYIITLVQGMALEDDKTTRLGIANAILEALQELEIKQ